MEPGGTEMQVKTQDGQELAVDAALGMEFEGAAALAAELRVGDVAGALLDCSIGGDPRARPDQHKIAQLQIGDGYFLRPAVDDSLGSVRQQLGQFAKCALGAADCAHLEPMTEQHDGHQCGQFPVERHAAYNAKRDRQAVDIRRGDRQRDERHHARPAAPQLGDRPNEEHPAAIPIDDAGQNRRQPFGTRKLRRQVAEQLPEQFGVNQHRNGEHQGNPERPREHILAVAGVHTISAVMPAVPGRLVRVNHGCLQLCARFMGRGVARRRVMVVNVVLRWRLAVARVVHDGRPSDLYSALIARRKVVRCTGWNVHRANSVMI